MVQKRRDFLKKVALGSSVTLYGVEAVASSQASVTNGVVVGKSTKKEITYKKTKAWDDYYRSSL